MSSDIQPLAEELTDEPLRPVPVVRCTANPSPETLLRLRAHVTQSPALKGVLARARHEGLTEDQTTRAIFTQLSAESSDDPEVRDAVTYLAAEHLQHGDGILLVSRTSGRAIAKLTEADLWQPPPRMRQGADGTERWVTPPPQIRPDLEGMLIEYHATREHEQRVLAERSIPSTAWLQTHGDPRSDVLVKEGRDRILRSIRERLAQWPAPIKNPAALAMLSCTCPPDETSGPLTPLTLQAKATIRLSDLRSLNLRFSWEDNLSASLATDLLRGLCTHVRTVAVQQGCASIEVGPNEQTRVASYGQCAVVDTFLPQWTAVPVFVVPQAGYVVRSRAVHLEVGAVMVRKREIHDRADFLALASVRVWVDPSCVTLLDVVGDEPPPHVEVVR